MTEEDFARALRLVRHLPGVSVQSHYGRPALKVEGKAFAGYSREQGALGVHCPLDLKEHLIEARPDLFFETDHYRGWHAVLVRMEAIDDETLKARLEAAWAAKAPKRLLKEWQARQEGDGGGEA